MSIENLPSEVDVVVLGTGLCESMVAASLSRIGKKVLHVDRNSYYGSQWATFNFNLLLEWADGYEKDTFCCKNCIPSCDNSISNIAIKSNIPESSFDGKDCVEQKINQNCSQSVKSDDTEIINSTDSNLNDDDRVESVFSDLKNVSNEKMMNEEQNKENLDKDNDLLNVKSETDLSDEKVKYTSLTQSMKKTPSMVSQAKIKSGKNISLDDLKVVSQKFNLDICFKFLFSAGPLVNAIIKANISHYAEFKLVNRILMIKDGDIIEVPCNRADVFTSPFLSVIEKRILMKFLTYCMENNDVEDDDAIKTQTFEEFLVSHRLSDNLQKFIIYSIAMVKPQTNCQVALKSTKTFLNSLGKYGKSPFIWPLFGIGELPQSFCRMSAVFGGVYALHIQPERLMYDESTRKYTGLRCNDQDIKCDFVVTEQSYLPSTYKSVNGLESLSKAILITNQSLLPANEEFVTFLTVPPLPGMNNLVSVLEIGPASCACPSGLFVLYLTCQQEKTAVEDLKEYVELLTVSVFGLSDTKPMLLWSLYFNQAGSVEVENLPDNLFVAPMPDVELGFHKTVEAAKVIFNKIAPEEEFLLSVPNPEDIIWGSDKNDEVKDSDEGNKLCEGDAVVSEKVCNKNDDDEKLQDNLNEEVQATEN